MLGVDALCETPKMRWILYSRAGLAAISSSCRSLQELFLERSDVDSPDEIESSAGSSWLEKLAFTARHLEELNIQYTTGPLDIVVSDLELLMENCKALKSLKLNDTDIVGVGGVFANSMMLLQLGTGSWKNVGGPQASSLGLSFPRSINGLSGLYEFADISVPLLSSVLGNLTMLNLFPSNLTPDGHQEVLRRANLEDLTVNTEIGDIGILALAASCRNLRRLRIKEHAKVAHISPVGITPLAQACVHLEILTLYVTSLDNVSLTAIGANCKSLQNVSIHLIPAVQDNGQILDEGVKALLEGTPKVTRFTLYLVRGMLTNTGMAYIGKYGSKLKSIQLGAVGESDVGLLSLARGCKSLEHLEIINCPNITEYGLAQAVIEMENTLKFLSVKGFVIQNGGRLFVYHQSHWVTEFNPSDDPEPERNQITAYRSLTGPRISHISEIAPSR